MAKKDGRFAVTYQKTTFGTETTILVDRETGVHYLYYRSGYGGGLTPLLDREGRPVITTVWEEPEQ